MQLRHFVTVSSGMEVTGLKTLKDAKMSNLSDSTVYGSEQRTCWIESDVMDSDHLWSFLGASFHPHLLTQIVTKHIQQ